MPAYPTIDPLKPAAPAASPKPPGGAYPTIDPANPVVQAKPPPAAGTGGGYDTIDPNQGSPAGTGTWGDFGAVTANESMMNSLPGLRSQADAARKRLGENWSAAADMTGSIASPTSLLNLVPGVGPELAGGVHEGVKSYMSQPDWVPSGDALKQIGKDAAGGVATAGLGHGAAQFAPQLAPMATKLTGAGALPGLAAKYVHDLYGSAGVDAASALGLFKLLERPTERLAEGASKIADQPATQNIIKLMSQGAGSALRNSSPGPLWNQWVPGQ